MLAFIATIAQPIRLIQGPHAPCCPASVPRTFPTMAKKRPTSKSKPKSKESSKSNTLNNNVKRRNRASSSSSSSSPSSSSSSSQTSPDDEKLTEPELDTDQFIPRGPTLRAEYERKGIIEPTLGPNSGILPQVVANRMIRRIMIFGGIPLSLLFAFFAVYFLLKYKYDITVLPVVVAFSTLGTVGLATAGITYGILSSSWDDAEGSRLGLKETKVNFMRAKDGLVGTREREKLEDELDLLDQYSEEQDRLKEKEEQSRKKDNKNT